MWGLRFLGAIVLALAFGYLPYRVLGEQGMARAFRLEADAKAQTLRVRKLEQENQALRREIHGLRTDLEAVEGVARDELGMVKADEIVFQVEGLPLPDPAARTAP